MAKTLDDILGYFKSISPSESAKGKLFEMLMFRWLRTDTRCLQPATPLQEVTGIVHTPF